MPRVDIFLKSGGILTLDVEELAVQKTQATNQLTEISWKLEEGSNRPLFLCLDDISAVVEAR